MSDGVNLEKFEVELRLDCTVKVGDWDFVKPGVSSRVRFDGIPEYERLKGSMQFIQAQVLEPTLNDIMQSVHENVQRQFGASGGT